MYKLTVPSIGTFPQIELSLDEYTKIIRANEIIKSCLEIEDKYEYIIGNFIDLQNKIILHCTENALRSSINPNDFMNQSRILNRVLFNFLSSASMYFDHLKKSINRIENELYSTINELIRKVRNTSISFKLMEALRNHMHHSKISTWSGDSISRIGTENETLVFFFIPLVIDVDSFFTDSKTKRLFKEYLKDKKQIEINDHLLRYLTDIYSIQSGIRAATANTLNESKDIIDKWINEYEKAWPKMKTDNQKILGIYQEIGHGFEHIFSRNALNMIEALMTQNAHHCHVNNTILSNISTAKMEILKRINR